ncbi:MAG: hypothetical protein LBS31_10095 [Candidatus Adiutrix sp.]|jgi:hypothetical protein|nr:hypothetical protein [Candidatus Adiutrix sp.]
MAGKKAVNLSKLPFNELKDKAKEINGVALMNRFEITQAVKKAEGRAPGPEAEKLNPRKIKPEILALKNKLAAAPKDDKKTRKALRRAVVRLKRETRLYLRQPF